jgi:TolB-like protein/Tfp pilus assembly protein PilF
MPGFVGGFEYDVFISYRQNDNRYDGWVTEFVENLQKELVATIKADIKVYFDENPHDGLLETHQVDESLNKKLKCLIFIPIVSQTYCDPNSFAWQHEFLVFKKFASEDALGMRITLPSGNVCARILPVKIHNLDETDQALLEKELGGSLRSIEFIYQAPGINRPLDAKHDDEYRGQNKPIYRDQINKVANCIKEVLVGIKNVNEHKNTDTEGATVSPQVAIEKQEFSWATIVRRNLLQVALVYAIVATIIFQLLISAINHEILPAWLQAPGLLILIATGAIGLVLAWKYEFAPEGIIRTSSWESRLNPYPGYKRKPFTGLVTITTLLLVLFLQTFYTNYYPSRSTTDKTYLQSKVIAVLPFENVGGNTDIDYYTAGLTESIIIRLSQLADLKIIALPSVKQYKGQDIDVQKVGEELGVSAIVTCSYREFADSVRLAYQLIDVATNHLIGGGVYDNHKNDIFAVESKIALDIAIGMEVQLSDMEKNSIEKEPTANIIAYDHYLKGRSHYYKYSQKANDSAIMEFKQAIQLDPDYVLAWAGLGDAYSQMNRLFGLSLAWNDSSKTAGTRAVRLDSSSSEAYKALANAYYYAKQYDEAFDLLEKAVSLSPSDAKAMANLGNIYLTRGELYEAIKWMIKGADLDPNGFITPINIGWTYRLLGNLDKAEYWLNRSIRIRPYPDTYRELGYTYVLQGNSDRAIGLIPEILKLGHNAKTYEEAGLIALFAADLDMAEAHFKQAATLNENLATDPNTIAPLVLAYLDLNGEKHDMATTELQRLEQFYIELMINRSDDDDPRINMAGVKIMQKDQDAAILWLKRAIDVGWIDLAMINHIPWFAPLRSSTTYKQTTEQVTQKLKTMRDKADLLE